MRNIKKGWFRGALNGFFIDSPLPGNLSYFWNFGSLLGATLALQIVTGVGLAMHYNPSISLAFSSVEHITRDVFGGSLLRYAHANGASVFFIIIFLHIGRNLYYGSFTKPRVQLWAIGVVILILLIVIAFLGYVCPWGQMSLWGAVVITNLLSVIPWVGTDLVEFIWGGFSVGNPTLNRFFALHFLAPFILSALVFGHLMALHSHGSNNPTGVFSGTDKGSFNPYYSVKDLVTLVLWLQLIVILACYMPNVLGR